MTVPAFVVSLADFGERVALVDDSGERVTYAELDRRVETLAAGLGDQRRLVMVEVASTIPSVVAYLAALRGGHAVIAGKAGDADPRLRSSRRFSPGLSPCGQRGVHRRGAGGRGSRAGSCRPAVDLGIHRQRKARPALRRERRCQCALDRRIPRDRRARSRPHRPSARNIRTARRF